MKKNKSSLFATKTFNGEVRTCKFTFKPNQKDYIIVQSIVIEKNYCGSRNILLRVICELKKGVLSVFICMQHSQLTDFHHTHNKHIPQTPAYVLLVRVVFKRQKVSEAVSWAEVGYRETIITIIEKTLKLPFHQKEVSEKASPDTVYSVCL